MPKAGTHVPSVVRERRGAAEEHDVPKVRVAASRGTPGRTGGLPGLLPIITILSYIVIWVASCFTPVIFAGMAWMVYQEWVVGDGGAAWAAGLGVYTAVIAACYVPTKGMVWPWLRRQMATQGPQYMAKWRLSFEEEEEKGDAEDRPVMYGVHPHGVFCMGWGTLVPSPEFSGVRFCFADALYLSPLFRALCNLISCPSGVSLPHLLPIMKQQQDLALIPGGFEEASLHVMDKERVYLKGRRGFIKLALQHGYDVRAVYSFGERSTYYQPAGLYWLRLKLNSFKLPAILPFGWALCPILPKPQAELDVWVSARLRLPHIPNPSRAEVAHWHGVYVARLRDLHARRKGAADPDLEIW
eukprot:TRINITY_DN8464_c0_g1_i1.p1 TRINITY_DN8464_c0_g1~~TRINITY_DN8464_c0_g1_i1.p1  ORF type:complete len:356 (+),score=114.80 TRINITY_DN8464_c0_g1_i1:127-1194(+)